MYLCMREVLPTPFMREKILDYPMMMTLKLTPLRSTMLIYFILFKYLVSEGAASGS